MQFTLFTSVFVACMAVFVSASPIPSPMELGSPVVLLAREAEIEVARSPEPEANPEPICSKYSCS